MNELDEHFAWLRSAMHAGAEVPAARLFEVTREVHALDEAFHREVWLPYLRGFPVRSPNYTTPGSRIGVGSLSELEQAFDILPGGMFDLRLEGNAQARAFARHPNPIGSALRRVRALRIHDVNRRTLREVYSSPNLVSCSDIRLSGGVKEVTAFVENPNARNITWIFSDFLQGTELLTTLGRFMPRGRLTLHLSLTDLRSPRNVAALFDSALGHALVGLTDYKSFSEHSLTTLTRLAALRGLETLMLCSYMPDDFTFSLRDAPMMESLKLLQTEHLEPAMPSARWYTFFETCEHWNLTQIHHERMGFRVAVSDDDSSWLAALARWRHLHKVDFITLSASALETRDVMEHIMDIGPEPFAHMRHFEIHGANLLEMLGLQ